MSDVKITIKTEAELAALEKTNKELENSQKATKAAGEATDQLTGRKRRLLEGFKALAAEIPVVNTLLMAGRNFYTLLGVAAVAAFVAIRKAVAEAKAEQAAYNAVAGNVRVSIDAYYDLKAAVDAVVQSQKDLAEQTKSTNEIIQQQIEKKAQIVEGEIDLLSAEEQRQAALIERDTQDPVQRARKLRENELNFGARKIGLRSALGKEQVSSIDQQIAVEREHQADAGAMVPTEAGLRGLVQGIEKTRQELEDALRTNRSAFQTLSLLQAALREGPDLNVLADKSPFDAGQRQALSDLGVLKTSLAWPGAFLDTQKIQGLLPGAESASAASNDKVRRLRGSLRAGIGQLPGRIASEAAIPDFLSEAEAEAAKTQAASYQREQRLLRDRERLERERANKAAVGGIQQQTAGIRGDIAISQEAEREATRMAQEIQRASSLVKQVTSLLGGTVVTKFDEQATTIEAINRRISNLERREQAQSLNTR